MRSNKLPDLQHLTVSYNTLSTRCRRIARARHRSAHKGPAKTIRSIAEMLTDESSFQVDLLGSDGDGVVGAGGDVGVTGTEDCERTTWGSYVRRTEVCKCLRDAR